MSVKIFISCVSAEFLPYREALRAALTRHNVEVKIQEDFKDLGGDTLEKLDTYIAHCDGILHLVGDMTGDHPPLHDVDHLRDRHPDFNARFHGLADTIDAGAEISYPQWAAWLALYHNKTLVIAQAAPDAPRAPGHAHILAQTERQSSHLHALARRHHVPALEFKTLDELVRFGETADRFYLSPPDGSKPQHTGWTRSRRLSTRVIAIGLALLALIVLLRGCFLTI